MTPTTIPTTAKPPRICEACRRPYAPHASGSRRYLGHGKRWCSWACYREALEQRSIWRATAKPPAPEDVLAEMSAAWQALKDSQGAREAREAREAVR